jgi:hypothetical protein
MTAANPFGIADVRQTSVCAAWADPPARSVYLDPFYVLTPGEVCYPVVGAFLDIGPPSIKVSQDGHGLVAVIAPARDL